MEAQWQANTITLKWYDNDTQFTPTNNAASGECTYDGALTVPSDTLSKTGYTFDGWTVRVAAGPVQCDFAGINNEYADWYGDNVAWKPINGNSGYTVDDALWDDIFYGPDRSNGLENGEWTVLFNDFGEVKGMALCSSTNGTYATTGTPDETGAGDPKNCWCKMTDFTPASGEVCSVSASSWVFYSNRDSASDCAYDCAFYCASNLTGSYCADNFCHALFGTVQ